MKVSKLRGALLDYWVARAIGFEPRWTLQKTVNIAGGRRAGGRRFNPTENWSQLGPLIEGREIDIEKSRGQWIAIDGSGDFGAVGESSTDIKEAACRAIVASVYGEETP